MELGKGRLESLPHGSLEFGFGNVCKKANSSIGQLYLGLSGARPPLPFLFSLDQWHVA